MVAQMTSQEARAAGDDSALRGLAHRLPTP
jgi:hypothetical protein